MNTSQTILLAGASSGMAKATSRILKAAGNVVIGISTKNDVEGYDEFYVVENYNKLSYPKIDRPLDGIVYFPGTINLKPFNRVSNEDIVHDFNVNVLGAVNFVQEYLPNLKKRNTASIVFVSSVAASVGLPFHASIAIAKGAISSLTISLAAELAPNIRVNAVAPSLVKSELSEKLLNTEEKIAAMKQRNPMKKIGSAEDIAEGICFLLSEKSAWISGQIIAIDGGMNNLKF